ncbi:ABC transporter permease [Propionibacteriaceae bacterium Y1700]|uniref:ABC transporter permease n=1 Tax=Microlunatus sp. Y1700 TaxID=3418487 RepID=UPI003DA74D51
MSALDLSPAPAPVGRPRAVWAHARTEAGLLLRNGEQLLLALIIPLGVLVLGRFLGGQFIGLDQLTGSVLAMGVWSTGFTATAISTGFERRYGVLERFAATPLTPTGLVLGKAAAVTMITLGQLIILGLAAVVLGWRPAPSAADVGSWLVTLVLSMISFVSLALVMAGRLRAELTLALANVVHLVVVVCGGLVVPLAAHPAGLGTVVGLLPTAALGEAFRALADPAAPATPLAMLVAAAWALVTFVLARKAFRWI